VGVDALRQRLATTNSIFIDTSIFSYVITQYSKYLEMAEQVLYSVQSHDTEGITSIVALVEILTIAEQAGDAEASRGYEIYLRNFPHLSIKEVDFDIARVAAQLRGKFKLKTPDALQIATALVSNVDLIITNNKQWRGKTADIPLIILDEL
jgi:predicted nucleic acid-binding protein